MEIRDYGSGAEVYFDGGSDSGVSDGLTDCYRADLGGEISGGTVTWLGSGLLSAHDDVISFEMTSGNIFRCELADLALENIAVDLRLCSCHGCDQ